jgi:hypothetical protein
VKNGETKNHERNKMKDAIKKAIIDNVFPDSMTGQHEKRVDDAVDEIMKLIEPNAKESSIAGLTTEENKVIKRLMKL